jgi:uncharacterized membrane protein YkoI
MKLSRLIIALLLLVLGAQPALAGRDESGKKKGGKPDHKQSQGRSPAQAAEIARKRTGGRVLSVKSGKDGYRVKVLTPGGEVRYVKVPGR